MAAVRQCDRCGALIDYKIYNTRHRIFKNSVIGSLVRTGDRQFTQDYDLCRECSLKLVDFLKGEELGKDMVKNEQLHAGGLY